MRWGAAAVVAVLALAGCDPGARKDLPGRSQVLVESPVHVYVNPDRFPNLVHGCDGDTGMWTDTDRDVWIVYFDPLCGYMGERPPFSVDNTPGKAS